MNGTKQYLIDLQELEDCRCDVVEIRLDRFLAIASFEEFQRVIVQTEEILDTKEMIYTIRTKLQGGEVDLSENLYQTYIEYLFENTTSYVDVELVHLRGMNVKTLEKYKSRMLVSDHDFTKTPDNLEEIWNEMKSYNPAIEKVAYMPNSKEDVVRLLNSCKEHKTNAEKIAISMSEMGKMSRLEGDSFGSSYTFCVLKETSAPGQISLEHVLYILDSQNHNN